MEEEVVNGVEGVKIGEEEKVEKKEKVEENGQEAKPAENGTAVQAMETEAPVRPPTPVLHSYT